jgi:aromatic ring-opening dioxygenase LigB subunit
MPLVFACIAPHGSIAIPEAKPKDRGDLASATTAGMQELGRRFDAARSDVSIVLTPHNVHVEGALAVVDAASLAGDLVQWGSQVSLRLPIDRELSLSVRDAIRRDGVPVVAVSYGANDPATSVFPMDWAVLIPAHFLGGRSDPPTPVVVVAPARDLADEAHVRAGRAIARAAAASAKRIALVASCDHGHGHDATGPYGFTPKSKEFDEAVVDLIGSTDGLRFSRLGSAFAKAAKADSYWQMLMLEGALDGDGWAGEVLSYEAPTYFGMVCASYTRTDERALAGPPQR